MGKKTVRKRGIEKCKKNNNKPIINSNSEKTEARIRKIFEKAQKEKTIKCSDILYTLSLSPHFIGCFAQDDLEKLKLCYPCFLMVNIDSRNEPGSHWLAMKLDKQKIEIFDPLGFEIFKWKSVPCSLLEFIHDHSMSKKFVISKRIQSDTSYFCGLYCIFYVFFRNFYSFDHLCSLFSEDLTKNDQRLLLLLDV